MSADILHFGAMTHAPNRIRELRLEAKLSQQALADGIGTSKVTISDLERGNMQLTQDYMRRIAAALGIHAADLLPIEDNPSALTLEERHLIDSLREADNSKREQFRKVAEVMLDWHPADPPANDGRLRKRA